MGKSCAIDLRVEGSSPAGQLLIYFHNVFPVLTKTLCRYSDLVPRSRIKASVRRLRCCLPRPSPPSPKYTHIDCLITSGRCEIETKFIFAKLRLCLLRWPRSTNTGHLEFREEKSNNVFREILKCFRKTAKFDFFAKQIYLASPDHPLQNDI